MGIPLYGNILLQIKRENIFQQLLYQQSVYMQRVGLTEPFLTDCELFAYACKCHKSLKAQMRRCEGKSDRKELWEHYVSAVTYKREKPVFLDSRFSTGFDYLLKRGNHV